VKSLSGKEFIKLLEKRGWTVKRIKGSHHIYINESNPARISVPVHGNKPLKMGLLKHFMKVAGIEEGEV